MLGGYRLRQQLHDLLPSLNRFAIALTGSRQDAEDLVQMTCEQALALPS
jgi:DNA-directed RNA polymerase specialized sigma24 family protein